jgi:DNA mismatch repair protein MutS
MQVFGVSTLEGFGCQSMPAAIGAAGAALEYLERTQASMMPKFSGISTYSTAGYLILDQNTRRNLEINETLREKSFEGSLLWILDKTRTSMGSRTLRKWLNEPLTSVIDIKQRQESIQELIDNSTIRKLLGQSFAGLADLERLSVKLSSATIGPRDLLAVKYSLELIPTLAQSVLVCMSPHVRALSDFPPELTQLTNIIASAIADDCPRELTEGAIFVHGYNLELDEIRDLLNGNKQWLENFQRSEQERTGVKSLKVGFNSTFGYYIEVSHANSKSVPANYIRKQTLTNAERYITPELKEYESRILNAQKNQNDLEYKLFLELRKSLTSYGQLVHKLAKVLSQLDVLIALAEISLEYKYVCPVVDESKILEIHNGRHPVLERILPMGKYVSNDTYLAGDAAEHQLVILTGPNMSGKSSYLRQVAQMVLLAQMGSFVPADYARVGIVDRIFTRIGAVDDLTQGQSTFLV